MVERPVYIGMVAGSSPVLVTSVHDCNWQTYSFQKRVLEGSSPSVRTNLKTSLVQVERPNMREDVGG